MKKVNKKGSHVSMILSFIIFVVALLFIYVIVSATILRAEPVKNEISHLEENVLKAITSEVWVLRFSEEDLSPSCFSLSKPESLEGESAIAFNDSGQINSSISGDEILVDGGSSFVKIYFSNLITNEDSSLSGCISIFPDSVRKEKVISEAQILNLMANFSNNYTKLKEELEVPTSMELDLYFEYQNGTTIGEIKKDPSSEVYSKELNLFFLSKSASNEGGKLRIKIW